MNPGADPWGEPLHRYTRAEAIADGVLVDVTQEATAGMLGGFAVPVAITAALHHAIQAIPPALEGIADVRGRLHDVLWMANVALRRQGAKLLLAPGNLATWHLGLTERVNTPTESGEPRRLAPPKAPSCQVSGPWGGNLAGGVFERFQVVLPYRGTRKRMHTLCLAVEGGDDGRPCVTIGFPEDF